MSKSMNVALVMKMKKSPVIGLMSAVTPRISVEFTMTLPIKLPKERSVFLS